MSELAERIRELQVIYKHPPHWGKTTGQVEREMLATFIDNATEIIAALEAVPRMSEACGELVDYALTCRVLNTAEWMRLFAEHINAAALALGDSDSCMFDGHDMLVIRRDGTP